MKYSREDGTIIIIKANPKGEQKCYTWNLKVGSYALKTPNTSK